MNTQALNKEREVRLIALSHQDHTNSLDILNADFGHWPPHGLDIVNPPQAELKLRPSMWTLLTRPKYWINLFDFQSLVTGIIMTQSIAKAAAIMVLSKLTGILGFVDGKSKERVLHLNELMQLYSRVVGDSEYCANVTSHEHCHILQWDDKRDSLTSTMDDDRDVIKDNLDDRSKMNKYLADEAEIQARLHTVLANAYQQHGVMPQNPLELLRALESQDVEVPPEAVEKLSTATYFLRKNFKFERDEDFVENNSDTKAVKELNKLSEALEDEFRLEFWTQHIPRLYGDLIELYGDSQGSARMGLGHNIQLRELFYAQVRKLCADPEANKMVCFKRMAQIVQMMPADQAHQLAHLVKTREAYIYGPGQDQGIVIKPEIVRPLMSLFHRSIRRELLERADVEPRQGPWGPRPDNNVHFSMA